MKKQVSPRDRAFKWRTELQLMVIDGYSYKEIMGRFDEMLGELLDEGDDEITLRTVNTLNEVDVMCQVNQVTNYSRFEAVALPAFTEMHKDMARMDRASLREKYPWTVRYAHEEVG